MQGHLKWYINYYTNWQRNLQ